jgi:NitT/TauT family transport system substrate-binding protein
MLLKAMQDQHISSRDYVLKNQSPVVGAANIGAGKIDAHADFCPWPELMEFRGTGRKIFDGSEAGVPYLHGVVVREDFAKQYPEVVVAFLKALYEAGDWIRSDPVAAAEKMEKWTGVEKEVLYIYFSKGGRLTLDPTIKPKWIQALKFDHSVLAREEAIPPLDFDAWITDRYIRTAYKELGKNYDAEKATIVDPARANADLPNEIWHARDGIRDYATVAEFLKALADFRATGAKINATYVYDRQTGLKLFGKTAFYVRSGKEYSTFLNRSEAQAFAQRVNGVVLTLDQALSSFGSLANS